MTIEINHKKPVVIADKFTFKNLLSAFLNSNIGETRIQTGKLDVDGKTVILKNGSITATQVDAKPGDTVVIHQI